MQQGMGRACRAPRQEIKIDTDKMLSRTQAAQYSNPTGNKEGIEAAHLIFINFLSYSLILDGIIWKHMEAFGNW